MRTPFIVCVIFILISGISCTGRNTIKEKGKPEKIYYFPLTEIPEILDPAYIATPEDDSVIGEIFDGLVCLDESYEVQPEIAESWDYNPKTTTYTFHLREDIEFHNGFPLTSEDVKFSFERLFRIDDSPLKHSDKLLVIKGAGEYKNKKANEIEGIRIIDDYTVEIELSRIYTPFLKLLTMTEFSIVSKDEFEEENDSRKSKIVPIGSGPFSFKNREGYKSLHLTANTDYYKGRPKIDGIMYKLVDDPEKMMKEYQDGKLHHIAIDKELWKKIIEDEELEGEIINYPVNIIHYFVFDLDRKQFGGSEDKEKKRLIRQAMNFAVDRDYICDNILKDRALPFYSVIPEEMLGYRNPLAASLGFKFDFTKAKEILSSANCPDGKCVKKVVLNASSNPEDVEIAEAVKKNLTDIGFEVEVELLDEKKYLNLIDENDPSIYLYSSQMTSPDFDNYFALFHGKNARGGINKSNLTRDYVNDLIDRVSRTESRAETRSLYMEIEKELNYDSPWLLLYQEKNTLLLSHNVEGLKEQLTQLDYDRSIPNVRMEKVDIVLPQGKKRK